MGIKTNFPNLSNSNLLIVSFLVRAIFFLYGILQDAMCQVKYTDVDYLVFNDAASYTYQGLSPYLRDTYRYTPLLSYLLIPNHYFTWFHLGKIIFIIFDLLTGIIINKFLQKSIKSNKKKCFLLGSLWLLNPIVITISTRGNAESVLCFLIMSSLYFLQEDNLVLAGLLYGASIHFKIYPIIYCLPISIYLFNKPKWILKLFILGTSTLISLIGLTYYMYTIYGYEYLDQAWLYHLYRTDHRHNFSLWNVLLYFNSSFQSNPMHYGLASLLPKFAFLPQMIIVLALSYLEWLTPTFNNLLNTLFVQTFAFVTYNKVCTSQYFVWYLIFLPLFLQDTTISAKNGIVALGIWISTQAIWLSQGYYLEFLGRNIFYPDLFYAAALFFIGNVALLGMFIKDIKLRGIKERALVQQKKE
ncbi:hypothetical protein TBLA_0B07690 [Henningerozyma blattae CBS 6284]|uniref:GPI mannosyltransferase 1 n=1 Tax=Henningerozyma blattae (strain ATCC 34711 / CBS 6284 / DSM 70876 / NBRC 10599 / NRRL Y-10934 / UCD 77-7) TaxID=1071380 RepID=I2GZN3_HENB6|nr:hypothetical protein TBLA_0B07690 [Tetrapisispora blattae CBS 6284]CCH59585.1 hypothetical protein TBLA_0B07690 [Tetrapisispora blattae CBS 6284]